MWDFIKKTILCIVALILCLVTWRLITWFFILIAFYGFHLEWYRDLAATITLIIIAAGGWFADDLNKKSENGTVEADKKEDINSNEAQIVNEIVKKKKNKVYKTVGQVAGTIAGVILMAGLYLGVDNLIGDKDIKADISIAYPEETTTVNYGNGYPRLDSTQVSEMPAQTTQTKAVAITESLSEEEYKSSCINGVRAEAVLRNPQEYVGKKVAITVKITGKTTPAIEESRGCGDWNELARGRYSYEYSYDCDEQGDAFQGSPDVYWVLIGDYNFLDGDVVRVYADVLGIMEHAYSQAVVEIKYAELLNNGTSDDVDYSVINSSIGESSEFYYNNSGIESDAGYGYVIEGSDTRYLMEEELKDMSKVELRLARNEIYARHGRLFGAADLQDYFNSMDWYIGYIPADEFDESDLNSFEKSNLILIKLVEDSK